MHVVAYLIRHYIRTVNGVGTLWRTHREKRVHGNNLMYMYSLN